MTRTYICDECGARRNILNGFLWESRLDGTDRCGDCVRKAQQAAAALWNSLQSTPRSESVENYNDR